MPRRSAISRRSATEKTFRYSLNFINPLTVFAGLALPRAKSMVSPRAGGEYHEAHDKLFWPRLLRTAGYTSHHSQGAPTLATVFLNYLKLKSSYLISEIARRVKAYGAANPDASIIRLGIGDVTRPLPAAVIQSLHEAVDEMARPETFRGYGPEPGYEFLSERIAQY